MERKGLVHIQDILSAYDTGIYIKGPCKDLTQSGDLLAFVDLGSFDQVCMKELYQES